MKVTFIPHDLCTGCGACQNICPKSCIDMKLDDEKFYYPEINKDSCIDCGRCEKVCPVKNKNVGKTQMPDAYAFANNDDNIRRESSSGGVFSILSEYVLDKGGVVFGAALSEDCRQVKHIAIDNKEDLYKLRGSKYVQSSIGRCFQDAEYYLKDDRVVLFTGTPCQIEGLKRYLGKEYEQLYTIDLICHGVPSQYVWNKYLDYRENIEGSLARRVFFRHKKYGWKTYSLLLEYLNNNKYEEVFTKDLYLQAFVNRADLRPSCHQCNFKTISRNSDFTMADLWGVEEICPDFNDDMGISLLLVHSNKGRDIISYLKLHGRMVGVDLDLAIEHNTMAIKSAMAHPKRKQFIDNIDKMEFDELVKRYGSAPYPLRKKVRNLLRKLGLR